jgi:hypothetical protein
MGMNKINSVLFVCMFRTLWIAIVVLVGMQPRQNKRELGSFGSFNILIWRSMGLLSLLEIVVFFIREIGQKGPKSDISWLDQGAILDKFISTMFILNNGLFYWLCLVILTSKVIDKLISR